MVDVVTGASSYAGEVFIDVRSEEEWKKEHKPNAHNFEYEAMELGFLPLLPKTTRIAVYSNNGIRAGKARDILQRNGFTRARSAGALADAMQQ